MAITITISTNRQIKTADGGSIGATAGMTVELVTPPTATDAELQREFRHHYETITGAMRDQLAALNNRAPQQPTPANGTPKPATDVPAVTTTPKTNGTPATAQAPTATNGKTNGTAPTPKPAPQLPMQPAAQRIALDNALAAQFQPNPNDVNQQLDNNQAEDDEDEDDTPTTGIELLGWARHQPGDAKQEIAQIGSHRGFPRMIKEWSPTMVKQALQIYTRTSRN